VAADFGFAGMFWSSEASLALTHFRAYDPNLGRWLSRDPLRNAEMKEGPNLYAYVRDNPVNLTDPLGEGITWFTPLGSTGTLPTPVPYTPALPPAPVPAPPPVPAAPPAGPLEPWPIAPSTPGVPLYTPAAVGPGTGVALADTGVLGTGCSAGELAGPLAWAFSVGVAVGTVLDDIFGISGWASDRGVSAQKWAQYNGYSDTTSREVGGLVTLMSIVDPGGLPF